MDALNNATAIQLYDGAGRLLARAPIAPPGFERGSGGLVAKLLRSVAIASGDAVSFRIVASDGFTLEEGPIGLTNRQITAGAIL